MTQPTGYPIAGAPRFAEVPLAEVRVRRGAQTWALGVAPDMLEGKLMRDDEAEDEADR